MSKLRFVLCVLIGTSLPFTIALSAYGQASDSDVKQDSRGEVVAAAIETAQKEARAEEIVALTEKTGGRSLDPRFRKHYITQLASALSLEELDAILYDLSEASQTLRGSGAGWSSEGLDAASELSAVPQALGDSSADLVYTPVVPCRIIDTRAGTIGRAPGNAFAPFQVTVGDWARQGGNPAGCGVPFGPATAAVINFAAVDPAGLGNLRAWAYDDPMPPIPDAVVLNFGNVAGKKSHNNGIVVPICDVTTMSCAYDMFIFIHVSATDIVADVVGYFSAPVHDVQGMVLGYAYVNSDGSVANSWMATGGTPTVTRAGAGDYRITWPGENVFFDDTPVFITPQSANLTISFTSFGGGSQTGVFIRNSAGTLTDSDFWVMILQDHNP